MSKKYIIVSNHDELYHHGIKGQKWGVRRFQNEDGSLTPAGVKRYQTDQYGNMTKKGAANYYKDIYNEAKSMGYRGQGVHDYVRQHFNNEGEYQAFVDNYRKYKGKKALTGIAAGAAGLALTGAAVGAGAYGAAKGISKIGKRAKEDAILEYTNQVWGGKRLNYMSTDELMKTAHMTKKEIDDTFSTGLLRKEAQRSQKAAEILASRRLAKDTKDMKKYLRNNNLSSQELADMIYKTNERAASATKGNSEILNQQGNMLRKAYSKRIKKDFGINTKMAALEQTRIETGKDAIQNRMNAFSNSLFGQIATGAGTTIGAMYVNAQVEASRRAIENMYDQDTANRIAPNSLKIKEYKDRSSVLTMPQRMDNSWKNTLKGNVNTSSKSNDDDEDDEDEDEKKRRS